MNNYIRCIVLQSTVLPYQSCRTVGSDPHYSWNNHFSKEIIKYVMFLERYTVNLPILVINNTALMVQYLRNDTDFHETYKRSNVLTSDPLYQISPKLDNRCIKYRHKFTYAPLQYAVSIAQIKKKLAFTEYIFEDNSYFDFYPNWAKNVENMGKISFMP
jgi:hypothetical protein